MANSVKREGIKQLFDLKRRVDRQYNLQGRQFQTRICKVDRDNLMDMIDVLITYIENMDEDSPDLKERPF